MCITECKADILEPLTDHSPDVDSNLEELKQPRVEWGQGIEWMNFNLSKENYEIARRHRRGARNGITIN